MRSLDSFWAKVDVRGPDECWEWAKARYRDNYGVLGLTKSDGRKSTMRAHAFALVLTTGEDQGGRYALHGCDNPPCCNPAHLYWGDQKRNIRDMDERGRANRPIIVGSAHGNAKLNEDNVREMRSLYATGCYSQIKLADLYGVSQQVISCAIRGITWGHVPTGEQVRDNRPIVRGSAHGKAKLTELDVLKIRELYAAGGVTQEQLGLQFGIKQPNVSHIVRGDGWSSVAGSVTRTRDRYRLNEDHVREIRRLCATGDVKQRELADSYGISQAAVSSIICGVTWSHVPE